MRDEPRRRLTRSANRKLGGVAGGIADYVDVDPTLVRVLFVLAVFLGLGTIIPVYVVLWIIMPDGEGAPTGGAPVHVRHADPGLILGGALVVIGGLLLLNELAIDRWFGFGFMTVAWPVVLVAAGVILVLRARDEIAR